MSRFHVLALVCALLIPAILPQHPVASKASPARGVANVQVATRPMPPSSLEEALIRVVLKVDAPLGIDAHCLAQAIYFEARSEPIEGQLAVAQVVLNRVSSKYWPDTICGVVFQNEHRRHSCQFSFACDGRSDRPHNPRAWKTAKMVAGVALEDLWRDITQTATHYHADYVTPYWTDKMTATAQHGRHVFYRDSRQTLASNAHAAGGN